MISSSRLKAKQILSEGCDKAVSKAIDELGGELTRFASNTRQYKPVFARLAKQAVSELGRKDFDILVNKRDLPLAKSLGYSAKTSDIIGGVIASSKDGLIRVNNSFDVLLEEKREILRMAAFQELFGKNAGNK
jgi:vacuolar-type H+-ATPase subunit E/Vma4